MKIIGAIMLGLFFILIGIASYKAFGLYGALRMWGIATFLTTWVVVGVLLLTEWKG